MARQGTLDGLCGPYAIVNAYDQCEIEEGWLGEDDIFAISCSAINGWPDVLWEGTTFTQMITMIKACQKALSRAYNDADCEYPISVSYPFRKKTPKTNKEYWKRFNKIFSRDEAICGIVGMERPSEHWFAFSKRPKTLSVYDSANFSERGIQRIRLENIHAGVYEKRRYLFCRKEFIVFSKKA